LRVLNVEAPDLNLMLGSIVKLFFIFTFGVLMSPVFVIFGGWTGKFLKLGFAYIKDKNG